MKNYGGRLKFINFKMSMCMLAKLPSAFLCFEIFTYQEGRKGGREDERER